jgi:hypothetical protein
MLICCVNCMTWMHRYTRKASLDQRPMSMMVYTGRSAMYMAMAAADWIEWVPSRSVPISAMALRMRVVISFPAMTWINFHGLSGVGLVACWK